MTRVVQINVCERGYVLCFVSCLRGTKKTMEESVKSWYERLMKGYLHYEDED